MIRSEIATLRTVPASNVTVVLVDFQGMMDYSEKTA